MAAVWTFHRGVRSAAEKRSQVSLSLKGEDNGGLREGCCGHSNSHISRGREGFVSIRRREKLKLRDKPLTGESE